MKFATLLITTLLAMTINTFSSFGQCADSANIYSFYHNGNFYELVRESKTWVEASACAVERGGRLAEIMDGLEQDAIFNELTNNAGINNTNTIASDGGGASYVWIGGNDLNVEGDWIWDGDNFGGGAQFWVGASTGNPVGGLFNNWGDEPDDFGSGQDGLGFALTDWPLGVAGQWNDVYELNTLHYLIEYPSTINLGELESEGALLIYPNPADNLLFIESDENEGIVSLFVTNLLGQQQNSELKLGSIDISKYKKGLYFLQVELDSGQIISTTFIKN